MHISKQQAKEIALASNQPLTDSQIETIWERHNHHKQRVTAGTIHFILRLKKENKQFNLDHIGNVLDAMALPIPETVNTVKALKHFLSGIGYKKDKITKVIHQTIEDKLVTPESARDAVIRAALHPDRDYKPRGI